MCSNCHRTVYFTVNFDYPVQTLDAAVRSPKSLRTLRAAVPLALARTGTDAARDLLLRRLKDGGGNTEARSARLLALGFFPDAALEAGGPRPSSISPSTSQRPRRPSRF